MKIISTTVTLDAAEVGTESAFWAAVFGGEVVGEGEYREIRAPDGTTPVGVQLAPGQVATNWPEHQARVHLDVVVEDIDSAHDHVLSLGATLLQRATGEETFNV
ncbi:VOC family protein [Bogoriella caseilytica]|uniref:Glyoxalase-like domain-containing protein n=1 Tax=Bogoriella caseilytica TaxID=56055 RepID=A0A3N2BGE7_9MICO|nr:VOC family protein [Bogoriella caseilytica]ROR74134.1 hypothetical protein EDD31_2534 [Bogoriella caseilytica]